MRRVAPLVLTLAVFAVALPAWGVEAEKVQLQRAIFCEAGQESPEPEEAEEPAPAVDLMAALKASVEAAKKGGEAKPSRAKAKSKSRSKARAKAS